MQIFYYYDRKKKIMEKELYKLQASNRNRHQIDGSRKKKEERNGGRINTRHGKVVAERSDNRSSNVQSFEPRVFRSIPLFSSPFYPDLRPWHGSRLPRGRPPWL